MWWFWTFAFFIHVMRRSKTASKNHSKNSSKINENWLKNEFRIKHPVGDPFWSHFGPILDRFWAHFRPEIVYLAPRVVQNRFQEASGTQLRFSLIFRLSSRSPRRQGATPSGASWRTVASRRNHWFWGKPRWESSPSASCEKGPRKREYRKLRFLWKIQARL